MALGHLQLQPLSAAQRNRMGQRQLLAHKWQVKGDAAFPAEQHHLGDRGDGPDALAGALDGVQMAHLLGDGGR